MTTEATMPEAPAGKTSRGLRMSRTFAAPRELIFEAFTQEQHLLKWWGPRDYPVAEFSSDPRPGGAFNMCMVGPNGEQARAMGEYEELTPPERIVTRTWIEHEGRKIYESRCTVTLKEHAGYTRLVVQTEVLFDDNFPGAAGAEEGWGQTLDKLGEYLVSVR